MSKEIDKYVAPLTDKGLNQYMGALLKLKSAVGANLFAIGGLLSEVKAGKLYAEQHDSWNSFLGDPGVSMNRTFATKLIKVYEAFALRTEPFPAHIEIEKLYMIAPFIKDDPEDSEGWILRADTLSRSDLDKLRKLARGEDAEKIMSFAEEVEEFFKGRGFTEKQEEFGKTIIEAWETR